MKNIGVDIRVCKDAVCGYFNSSYCDIYKDTPTDERIGQCNIRTPGCPIPHTCPYKNLHILSSRWIGEIKCPCVFPYEPPFQEDK